MGLGKSLKKAFKKATKAVTKTVKSVVTSGADAIKAVSKGDLTGLADAAVRMSSAGTISLKDKGLLNAGLGVEQQVEAPPTQTTEQPYDGLLAYVTDQRNRRAKRNRQSTNNTNGNTKVDGNRLSGTTALGV